MRLVAFGEKKNISIPAIKSKRKSICDNGKSQSHV